MQHFKSTDIKYECLIFIKSSYDFIKVNNIHKNALIRFYYTAEYYNILTSFLFK